MDGVIALVWLGGMLVWVLIGFLALEGRKDTFGFMSFLTAGVCAIQFLSSINS